MHDDVANQRQSVKTITVLLNIQHSIKEICYILRIFKFKDIFFKNKISPILLSVYDVFG